MKRWIWILLSLLLLLSLAACEQPDNISDDPTPGQSAEANLGDTEKTEPDEPEKPEEPEEPEEPQELSWLPEKTEKLSYEEYFSEDRPYFSDYTCWLVADGQAWKGYELRYKYGEGYQVVAWDPSASEKTALHTVPDTVEHDLWELLGTDGVTAYLFDTSGSGGGIMAVDLLTGSREFIIQDAVITSAYYRDDVLYYAVYKDDTMQIVRRYLPTGDELYYPTGQTLALMFSFYLPQSTQGAITWVGVTEKMTKAAIAELQNPDSKYRDGETVPPELWEMNEPWIYADRNPVHWLCLALQKSTGYRTLYKCTMSVDGSVLSEATGVVDSCWYGSDMSHDHYAPDAEPPAKPVVDFGPWMPFVNEMTGSGEEDLEANLEVYQDHLYITAGNTFTLLTDIPIRSVFMTEVEWGESMNAYYGITADDQLVRLYPDGTAPTVLYQGTKIRKIAAEGDYLVLLDDNQVVQLDLQNQSYRTVLHHDDILRLYFDYEAASSVVYIEMNRGLHSTGYLVDLTTGAVKEVGYRL